MQNSVISVMCHGNGQLVVWWFSCLATPHNRLTVVWSFGGLVV